MYKITVWCNQDMLTLIKEVLAGMVDFRICESVEDSDVLLLDISDERYCLANTMPKLKQLNGNCIFIMVARTSDQLLDVVGLSVFQFILHEQLVRRLPQCFFDIHTYLMTTTTICIHVNQKKHFVKISEIYYVRIEDTFVYIGLSDRELTSQFTSLEKVKGLLGITFQYANRTTIINGSMVTVIGTSFVQLGRFQFTLSRRRRKSLIACCEKERWQS